MSKTKSKKLFSIKYKLMIVFGILTAIVVAVLTVVSIRIERDAVMEKVEHNLKNKAQDVATIIDAGLSKEIYYL